MYVERGTRPRRATQLERRALVLFGTWLDWRSALVVVKPRTFIAWQRAAVHSWWRASTKRAGRPPLPDATRDLVRRIARENPGWSCGEIARHLDVKLGVRVSPNSVKKYLPAGDPRKRGRRRATDQAWATFIRNHASQIAACDFVSVVTWRFQIVYLLVVMEIGSRRILQVGATSHPTAAWATQQLREALPADGDLRYLIHDRDTKFSAELDAAVARLGVTPVKTPARAPKANAYCERLIGTLRRECLDWIIPLSENHVRRVAREWATYYNEGRPHMSLGRGVPQPSHDVPARPSSHRHHLRPGASITRRPVLGGLHSDYRLADAA